MERSLRLSVVSDALSPLSLQLNLSLTFFLDINRMLNPSIATNAPADVQTLSPEPRILIISVSPDLSTSYIPLMNSIFSAQKLVRFDRTVTPVSALISLSCVRQKVTIDVCKVYGPDTVFLQQAAHLTGGSYSYLERRDALLQSLLVGRVYPHPIRKLALKTFF